GVGVGHLLLADDLVEHQVQQAVLAADVPVQRRGAGPELVAEPPHAQRGQALAVEQVDRGLHDRLPADRLAPPPGRPVGPPRPGRVLGGLLTGANLFGWEWRSVFYVNVPVAVAALIAGARLVPETKDPGARRPFVAGAVLLAGSLVAIVYPLLEGRQLGWPAWVWPLMAAGVAGLVVLGLIEARRTSTSDQGLAPLLR